MAKYKISGVWKDSNNVITHYAFHTITKEGIFRSIRKSKAQAVALLDNNTNSAITWVWNYDQSNWEDGEVVTVVNDLSGKYLRSNQDNTLTDNLGHLINYNWITP
jgi:hypothetical protein